MASPQLENGHIKIANEIFEALMLASILQYERAVFDCVMRRTYGWNKKSDWISLGQISDSTGISRTNVPRTIRSLVDKNMLIKSGKKLSIQKDWEKWNVEWRNGVGVISPDNRVLSHQITEVLSHEILTKDSKDTIQNKAVKTAQKIMKKKYHEDDLPTVDFDSGERLVEPNPSEKVTELIKWGEKVRGKKFLDWPAQRKMVNNLRIAGFKPQKIKDTYIDLLHSDYWKAQDRLPDFKTVYSNLKNKK